MNGYSEFAEGLTDAELSRQIAIVEPSGKYAGPSQDVFYKYRALLAEQTSREKFGKTSASNLYRIGRRKA